MDPPATEERPDPFIAPDDSTTYRRSDVPGARPLFVFRCVELAWFLLAYALLRLLVADALPIVVGLGFIVSLAAAGVLASFAVALPNGHPSKGAAQLSALFAVALAALSALGALAVVGVVLPHPFLLAPLLRAGMELSLWSAVKKGGPPARRELTIALYVGLALGVVGEVLMIGASLVAGLVARAAMISGLRGLLRERVSRR